MMVFRSTLWLLIIYTAEAGALPKISELLLNLDVAQNKLEIQETKNLPEKGSHCHSFSGPDTAFVIYPDLLVTYPNTVDTRKPSNNKSKKAKELLALTTKSPVKSVVKFYYGKLLNEANRLNFENIEPEIEKLNYQDSSETDDQELQTIDPINNLMAKPTEVNEAYATENSILEIDTYPNTVETRKPSNNKSKKANELLALTTKSPVKSVVKFYYGKLLNEANRLNFENIEPEIEELNSQDSSETDDQELQTIDPINNLMAKPTEVNEEYATENSILEIDSREIDVDNDESDDEKEYIFLNTKRSHPDLKENIANPNLLRLKRCNNVIDEDNLGTTTSGHKFT